MSAKYRDRLVTAALRFKEGTLSERALMIIIDAIIEAIAEGAGDKG